MRAVGYHESSGVGRKGSSGSHYVGDFTTGSWVAYRFDIPKNSKYTLELEVQSSMNTGVISVEAQGGSTVYGLVNVPNTSGQWVKVKSTI
jgi:hypothetical protein